jgi:hypothetical protein
MPVRDTYHEIVVRALEADGWAITADPLWLAYGNRDFYVDLAADYTALAAEKSGHKIAVEIKRLGGPSPLRELEQAVGQFVLYRAVLAQLEPERRLYLAIPESIYDELFTSRFGELVLRDVALSLFTFDVSTERIVRWIE